MTDSELEDSLLDFAIPTSSATDAEYGSDPILSSPRSKKIQHPKTPGQFYRAQRQTFLHDRPYKLFINTKRLKWPRNSDQFFEIDSTSAVTVPPYVEIPLTSTTADSKKISRVRPILKGYVVCNVVDPEEETIESFSLSDSLDADGHVCYSQINPILINDTVFNNQTVAFRMSIPEFIPPNIYITASDWHTWRRYTRLVLRIKRRHKSDYYESRRLNIVPHKDYFKSIRIPPAIDTWIKHTKQTQIVQKRFFMKNRSCIIRAKLNSAVFIPGKAWPKISIDIDNKTDKALNLVVESHFELVTTDVQWHSYRTQGAKHIVHTTPWYQDNLFDVHTRVEAPPVFLYDSDHELITKQPEIWPRTFTCWFVELSKDFPWVPLYHSNKIDSFSYVKYWIRIRVSSKYAQAHPKLEFPLVFLPGERPSEIDPPQAPPPLSVSDSPLEVLETKGKALEEDPELLPLPPGKHIPH